MSMDAHADAAFPFRPIGLPQVKHEILFDEVLMPWLIEWLMICSQSHHRGVRHLGPLV